MLSRRLDLRPAFGKWVFVRSRHDGVLGSWIAVEELHFCCCTSLQAICRMPVAGRRRHSFGGRLLLVAAVPGVDAFSSAECWVGGWTPEICCSAPGAKGNPLCWDSVFTYDRCCTETEEGIQFDLRRRNFVADMVRRGATVQFDIRQVFGGRTGAVASSQLDVLLLTSALSLSG
eukprot:s2403_g7.t1